MATLPTAKFASWEGIDEEELENFKRSADEVIGLLDTIEKRKAKGLATTRDDSKLEKAITKLTEIRQWTTRPTWEKASPPTTGVTGTSGRDNWQRLFAFTRIIDRIESIDDSSDWKAKAALAQAIILGETGGAKAEEHGASESSQGPLLGGVNKHNALASDCAVVFKAIKPPQIGDPEDIASDDNPSSNTSDNSEPKDDEPDEVVDFYKRMMDLAELDKQREREGGSGLQN
ncbi:hypothetical protein C8A00DRAFT_29426 [Chaetomidium leptoderma]|uniref:Uncharacterized protein n=1 Tax=Chaetomidium leptoderma TaxID=669021 RepID=A0AAN7A136_9PEZI|nr:hypothetical protein C8A00DRAFT_29426 [Chaetomidium leptoderma]